MNKYTRNDAGLTWNEVGALRAIAEAFHAGMFEDANRNLPRRMFDACQNYGKDRQGRHRPFDQSNILSAIAALGLADECNLLEKLPTLEASGALLDPLESPTPVQSALDVAREAL